MSRFKLFIAAVSITSLVMVTPWVISLYDEKSSQSSPINIALGASRGVLTAPVWIAEHEGYFSENGININIQEFNSGKASFAAMLAQDSLDLSTVAQTPITLSSFKRDDFAIIAAMVTSTKALKIVGRSDLGVTNVSDLKGKKVGLVKGSTGEFFLYLALIDSLIDESGVKVIHFKPPDLPVALQDGQVDAIVIWEPYALRALKLLADKARLLDTKDIYRQDFYFVAKKAFLDGKPEAAVRFLEAVYQAQKFIVENPQEAKRIIGKRMGLDSFELETQWNQFHFHLSLDQAMVLTLEDEARWAIGKGLVKSGTIPVYTDFFYTKALKQVDKNSALIFE